MSSLANHLGKLVLTDYRPFIPVVGKAYEARPRFERAVVSSWRSLIAHVDRLYDRMTSKIDVQFVSKDPYKDAVEMERDIRQHRRMLVYTGESQHPVWSEEENWRFRAVHDYMAHLAGGHHFTLRGEMGAYNRHVKLAPPDARLALFVEIVGQTCSYFYRGEKFGEQKVCNMYGFDFVNVGYVDDEAYQRNFE